jgi:SAM-dependent methyltransferase
MRRLRTCIPAGSKVLDVGGANVNGSYRELFADCRYTSLDYANADIVVVGYDWPIDDESYDAVVSGQTLEHDGWFWLTARNMARVLRAGGHLILIVPSAGKIHRHPVDCYRFNPDAMEAIGRWAGLELIETAHSGSREWKDLGGVFRKANGDDGRTDQTDA